MNPIIKKIKLLMEPAIFKHSKDRERVRWLFLFGNCHFSVDKFKGQTNSGFDYYQGSTGQNFSFESLSNYLLKYGSHNGWDLDRLAEAYADYAEKFTLPGDYAIPREELLSVWRNPKDNSLDLKNQYLSIHLDFCAHYLFDILKLEYTLSN
jgi:hypothetical protein